MARPSKPVQLIKIEGNKDRRTKKELDNREKAEQALYTGTKFKESAAVKADPIAHKEFLRLKKLYKHIQYVDGLDEQVINRYCIMLSEEQELKKKIDAVDALGRRTTDPDAQLEIFKMSNSLLTKLNQLRSQIFKHERDLYLNPTARVNSIPKKPPEEKNKSPMADFLKRRAGGRSD